MPYGREAEDDELEAEHRRKRSHVSTAAFEQSMGRGGEADLEVPVPGDDDALESIDTGAKVEWDALHPFSHRLNYHNIGESWISRLEDGRETNVPVAEALRWTTPERLQGPKRNIIPSEIEVEKCQRVGGPLEGLRFRWQREFANPGDRIQGLKRS